MSALVTLSVAGQTASLQSLANADVATDAPVLVEALLAAHVSVGQVSAAGVDCFARCEGHVGVLLLADGAEEVALVHVEVSRGRVLSIIDADNAGVLQVGARAFWDHTLLTMTGDTVTAVQIATLRAWFFRGRMIGNVT